MLHSAEQPCDFSSPSVNGTKFGTFSSTWVILQTESTEKCTVQLAAVTCAALGMVARGCYQVISGSSAPEHLLAAALSVKHIGHLNEPRLLSILLALSEL